MGDSYIYVASDGTTSKIGITAWPAARISGIKRDNRDYAIRRLWRTDPDTAIEIEELIIGKMAKFCIKGREWFNVPSHELIAAVDEIAQSNGHEIEVSDMPKLPRTDTRFELIMTPEHHQQAGELATILNERREEWRARPVTKSEAIRWSIAFTHKQLTEVLNPEDLRDDNL